MHEAILEMDRRDLIQNLALLLGLTALPIEALAAPKKPVRRFLAAPQYALLSAVADTLLPITDSPGAVTAQVPARIDSLLGKWASAKTRTDVLAALGRIDAAAKAKKKMGFAALSAADRAAILRPHDAAALKAVPAPPGAPKVNFFSAIPYVADQGYLKLKELVIDLYYFSAVANTKELTYEHTPGKFQPSIKLTPKSRPYLGTGPF